MEKNKVEGKDPNKMERNEDATRYGEFVSSFHWWMTPDILRERAKHHEEISKETVPDSMPQKGKDNKRK